MATSSLMSAGGGCCYNITTVKQYYRFPAVSCRDPLVHSDLLGGVRKLVISRRPRLVVANNSSDESSSSSSSTATETTEPETPAEVPKGPPSLISALNVEKALRGIAITDVDHYARLGLTSGCSYEQVNSAYQNKVAEVMSKGLAEEDLSKELELLKESHSILSSVEERRIYDWSLARSGKPDRYVWPFEVDITQTPTGTPPPQEEDDEGPTRLVGSIVLGWLMLSFVLFILFNR